MARIKFSEGMPSEIPMELEQLWGLNRLGSWSPHFWNTASKRAPSPITPLLLRHSRSPPIYTISQGARFRPLGAQKSRCQGSDADRITRN